MTDERRLELLDDDDPPPTPTQQRWIREAIKLELAEQMRPLIKTWDARSADMLDVLGEANHTRQLVVDAAATIRRAGYYKLIVITVALGLILMLFQLERGERAAFREAERLRRTEATQTIIDRMQVEASRIKDRLPDGPCSKPAN